ncbi:NAD-dependent protein deacetylase sirtuin-2 isoform X1 [Centruroides vittatus]|uniref:NAD-dependent protein deacetylase sirtuin-2 isoform X1 n=1 Tax=Centruroides vittatus TaxID=120091 RepID=UPI00350F96AF
MLRTSLFWLTKWQKVEKRIQKFQIRRWCFTLYKNSEETGESSGIGLDCPSEHREDSENEASGFKMMDMLKGLFYSIGQESDKPEQLLEEVNFNGICNYIKKDKCKNIIVMVGAGISTSAGIPDFRSPKSGLYANLKKYNLPTPECMFDIVFFRENPQPFFQLAKELYPGKFKPTPSHYFLKLLHDKGLLLRLYTQNIDTLERVAGIPEEKLIEAHGTFYTSHCINRSCRKAYSLEWMKEKIFSDVIPTCSKCESIVKPDIVFFGEHLPERFFECIEEDFPMCDLLIIIGTSLTVQPFASLVDNVLPTTPRLLINKEKCGQTNFFAQLVGLHSGLNFDSEKNYRDVVWEGDCDDGCQNLADSLGWGDELREMIRVEHTRIDEEYEKNKSEVQDDK